MALPFPHMLFLGSLATAKQARSSQNLRASATPVSLGETLSSARFFKRFLIWSTLLCGPRTLVSVQSASGKLHPVCIRKVCEVCEVCFTSRLDLWLASDTSTHGKHCSQGPVTGNAPAQLSFQWRPWSAIALIESPYPASLPVAGVTDEQRTDDGSTEEQSASGGGKLAKPLRLRRW